VSEALQLTGAIAAALLAAAGLLLDDARARRLALGAALLAAAGVVAGQAWDGQLADLRSEPVRLAGVAIAGAAVVGLLAIAFKRWRWGFPLAAIAVLAVRIPVDVGGESVNLLVPLYGVIAAGVLARLDPGDRDAAGPLRVPGGLALVLALAVVAYAVQAIYSNDVEFAARNVAFFLVPFAALFALLAERDWGPRLLAAALAVVAIEAVAFALVAIGQQALGELFWNDSLQASNDFHFYFRSNSVFWDPNIFGRYLAVGLVLLCAALLFERRRREAIWLAGAVAIAWVGLLCSFSQTSFIALLAGLLVLCALRFSLRWAVLAAPVLLLAVLGAIFIGGNEDDNRGELADRSSGHSTLIEGGLELAADRPLYGYGSASFPIAFREREDIRPGRTTVSHNEPVTVAAEQGLVGLIIYVALLLLGLRTLFAGMRAVAPGLWPGGGRPQADGRPSGLAPAVQAARIGIAAGFCALLVHTIGYASYLSDPLTWALLAIGSALAYRPVAAGEPVSRARAAAGEGAPLRSGA
jgi:putative inorganic carbon (HCO3(-)) transporter